MDDVKVTGRMSPDRRERIHKVFARMARASRPAQEHIRLTQARLEEVSRIAHVVRVVPLVGSGVVATLGNRPEEASVSCGAGEDPEFRKRVVFGRSFDSDDEKSVLMSEMFAYRIGLIDDADLDQVIGKPLRIEVRGQEDGPTFNVSLSGRSKASGSAEENAALRQLAWQIPGTLDRFSLTADEKAALQKAVGRESAKAEPVVVVADFRVVGIFRELTKDEREGRLEPVPRLHGSGAAPANGPRADVPRPGPSRGGLDQAVLLVDDTRNVKEVVDKVEALGMQGSSIVDRIERERLTYLLIFGGMTCVAAVALLVSSLGIANTMLMSVLERRREIGIMKAVGAANWQLQALYVIEGGLIGLIGGSLGLVLAWLISFPGDAWVRSMVHRDMNIELSGSIFAFPAWIAVTVLLFTVGVTIVAALYPSRRAAKLDPVSALRHD